MQNLTEVSRLLKKYSWAITAAVIILVLLVLLTIRYTLNSRPSKDQILETPEIVEVNIKTGKFNFDNYQPPKDYPKTLPAYTASLEDLLAVAGQIAASLNFDKPPVEIKDIKLGIGKIYNSQNASLTIYQHEASYTKHGERPLSGNFLSPEMLKKEAETRIADVFGTKLSDNYETAYFSLIDEFLVSVDSPEKANIVTMNFNPEVSGYTVNLPGSKLTTTFNRQNELVQFTYKMPKVEAAITTYPLISPKDAGDLLITGQASLITLKTQDDFSPIPQNLDQVNILSASLAYYLSGNSNTLQPVWIFSGNTLVNGQESQVLYAVPAIDDRYLLEPSPKP